MATIVQRKQGKRVSYQVKVRLKGLPARSATFARKSDAARWASATETHLREARHFPEDVASQHTLSEMVARYQREILPQKPKNAKNERSQLDWWSTQLGNLKLAAVTPTRVAECRARCPPEDRIHPVRFESNSVVDPVHSARLDAAREVLSIRTHQNLEHVVPNTRRRS